MRIITTDKQQERNANYRETFDRFSETNAIYYVSDSNLFWK